MNKIVTVMILRCKRIELSYVMCIMSEITAECMSVMLQKS